MYLISEVVECNKLWGFDHYELAAITGFRYYEFTTLEIPPVYVSPVTDSCIRAGLFVAATNWLNCEGLPSNQVEIMQERLKVGLLSGAFDTLSELLDCLNLDLLSQQDPIVPV